MKPMIEANEHHVTAVPVRVEEGELQEAGRQGPTETNEQMGACTNARESYRQIPGEIVERV